MGSQGNGVHRLLHFGSQQLNAASLCHGSFGLFTAKVTAAWPACLQLCRSQLVYRNCSGSAGSQAAVTPSSSSSSSSNSEPIVHRGRLQQHCKVAGRQWTFETGRLARLAHGSCQVTVGGTSVLATAVVDPTPQLEADGVPLQVEYRERLSAVGRLPSRADRRERSGSEREVLAARIIDRAVRPLIPPGLLYDTQVWCQVLSADGLIHPEVVAINAASAALLLAPEVPFTHPIGAVRAVNRRGRVLFNPAVSAESGQTSQLNLTYAGSHIKATAIEATALQVSEGDFIKTMRLAALATQPLIQAQLQLAGAAAGEDSRSAAVPGELQHPLQHLQQQQNSLGLLYPSQQLQQAVDELMRQPLQELFSQQPQQSAARGDKALRARQLAQLQRQLLRDLKRRGLVADEHTQAAAAAAAGLYSREDVLRSFDLLQSRVMRELLLQGGSRVDGRRLDQVRPVSCEAGPLPRCVHGSGIFTRGETQSLATATVGQDRDVAPVESLFTSTSTDINNNSSSSSSSAPLHLHYSFPPFSVGELGKSGLPNRREIGHGNLARSSLVGIMPAAQEFPFTVRVTADTLASSGSSSMAAVCAGSLALKAAGVPVQALAAGISIGLVTEHPPQLRTAAQAVAHGNQQRQQDEGASTAAASSGDSAVMFNYSGIVSSGQVQQQSSADDTGGDKPEPGNDSDCSGGPAVIDAETPAPGDSDSSSSNSNSSSSGAGSPLLSSSYGSAVLLTDIQGIEDHHGDMDFKVAGTASGITAAQLDTKLPGVDLHLLEAALPAAAAARRELLEQMKAAVGQYEASLAADDAPEYGTVQIMKDLVPRLIGPQGQTLLQIEASCGATLIVEDTGTISIYAPAQRQYQHALAAVQEVEGRGVQAGEIYKVRVLRVVDFGAYVSLPNGLPALLHISEVSHEKVRDMRDVLTEGDEFDVVCKGRDVKGFVRLSRKDLLTHLEAGQEPAGKAGKASRVVDEKGKKKEVPRMDTWQPL